VLTAPLLFIGESVGYLLSAVFLGRTRDGEQRLPAEGRNSPGGRDQGMRPSGSWCGSDAARCAGRGLHRGTAGPCAGHVAGRCGKPALRGAGAVFAPPRNAQAPGQRRHGHFLGSRPRCAPRRRRRHRLRCHHQCQRNNDVGPPGADGAFGSADPHQIAQRIRQAIRYPVTHHHPCAQGSAFKELPGGGDLRIHHFILGRWACMTSGLYDAPLGSREQAVR